MRTKNERPLRAAGRRRPGKQIVGVSERIRPTASDASVAAIAEGVQAGDMGEVVLYQAKGRIALDVRIERDTVWLTQTQMAKLFGRERSVVTKHVNNVFAEGELDRNSNVQNMHIASSDKPVAFYSLDTIGSPYSFPGGTGFPSTQRSRWNEGQANSYRYHKSACLRPGHRTGAVFS